MNHSEKLAKARELKDWQGNDILPGLEIVTIYIICIDNNSKWDELPASECWDVGEYYKVNENMTIIQSRCGHSWQTPVEDVTFNCYNTQRCILAIKGVSDTKPNNYIYPYDRPRDKMYWLQPETT